VGQFMASELAPNPGGQAGDAGIGDPAFMLVPPTAQLRHDYVVLTPPEFERDFLNLVAPTDGLVEVDGELVPPSTWTPLGTGEWSVARLEVSDGVHWVTAMEDKSRLAVLVYGFGQYVSYGYPGGLDLQDLHLVTPPGAFVP